MMELQSRSCSFIYYLFICDAQKPSLQIWLRSLVKTSKPFSTTFILFSSAPLLPSVPNPAQEETASRDKQGNGRRCNITVHVHVDVLRYKRETRRDLNRGRPIDLALRRRELHTFYFFGWQSNDKIFL